jgi:lipid A oxidase
VDAVCRLRCRLRLPAREFRRAPGPPNPRTFEYQFDGVAAEGLVGLEYAFGSHVSVFGEYKLSYSTNEAELDGGGSLDTNIWTNHAIVGLSYRFGGPPMPVPAPY